MPHVVISCAYGTAGDTLPPLALAEALLRRGSAVTIITDAYFAVRLVLPGASVHALGSADDTTSMLADAERRRNPLNVVNWWLQHLPAHYALLASIRSADPAAVFAGTPLDLAMKMLEDATGATCATIVGQPWMIRSLVDPPQFAGMPVRGWYPSWAKRACFFIQDVLADAAFGPKLNALRASLGLPPVRRVFHTHYLSKTLAIGFYPSWLSRPPDAPRQLRTVGFALADTRLIGAAGLDASLLAFLDAADADNAPVVALALGSAPSHHVPSVIVASIAACGLIGARIVVLCRAALAPPSPPPHAAVFPYAPFASLLPRCAAYITNGGIGAVSHALSLGIPMLVVPHGFDQFDNAARCVRLGVARTLAEGRCTPRSIAVALRSLIGTTDVAAACAGIAARLVVPEGGVSPLDAAAAAVEALAGGAKKGAQVGSPAGVAAA